MSLANLTVKATYTANGSNDTFAIPFDVIVDDSAETIVWLRDETTTPPTETLQEEGSLNDYQLTGAVLPGDFHTNVVFNAGSIPANGIKVIVIRELPLTQTLNLVTSFNRSAVNKAFDRVVAMIQQLDEKISRAPLLPVTEQSAQLVMPEPEEDKMLLWNASGQLENVDPSQTFAEISGLLASENNLSDLADAPTAVINLGIASNLVEDWSEYVLDESYFDEPLFEIVDLSLHSSVVFDVEIIRGTTVIANGQIAVQDLNGTGRILTSGMITTTPTLVDFSLDQTGTYCTLLVTVNPGPGNGTIKLRRWDVPA